MHWSQSAFSFSALFGCCICEKRCATQSDFVLLLCSSFVVSVGSCIRHCLHLPLHLPGKQISIIASKSCKSRRILWGESNMGKDPDMAQSDKLNEHLGLIINHIVWSPNNPWIHFHMRFTLGCCQYISDVSKRCKRLLLLCHDIMPTAL